MRNFNIILGISGKTGSKKINRNVIKKFTDWVKDIDMINIFSTGFDYALSNKKDEKQRIYTKLTIFF